MAHQISFVYRDAWEFDIIWDPNNNQFRSNWKSATRCKAFVLADHNAVLFVILGNRRELTIEGVIAIPAYLFLSNGMHIL